MLNTIVSIHAPHAEGDEAEARKLLKRMKFQSTPPMRRATPRGSRANARARVSIHAPHAEGDAPAWSAL